MKHNQQSIKNKLCSIAFEDNNLDSTASFLSTFNRSKNQIHKNNQFRQISDWTNRYQLAQQQPDTTIEHTPNLQQQLNRFSFLITNKNPTKYNSQLLPSNRKQQLQLSPITMKFATQSLRKNLRKQRQSNHINLMVNAPSFYELNYRPLSLLYQHRRKKDNQSKISKQNRQYFALPEFSDLKQPRTQRVSSIMRLMKKNQQLHLYKRQVGHSNQWQNFHIN